MSLFQTPGGKKFVSFLYDFSHFVVTALIKRQLDLLELSIKDYIGMPMLTFPKLNKKDGIEGFQHQRKFMYQMALENNLQEAGVFKQSAVALEEDAKAFVAHNTSKFKTLTKRNADLDATFDELMIRATEEWKARHDCTEQFVEDGCFDVNALENECRDVIRVKNDTLVKEVDRLMQDILQSLRTIKDIVKNHHDRGSMEEAPNFMDLTSIKRHDSETLPQMLLRLCAEMDDPKLTSVVPNSLPDEAFWIGNRVGGKDKVQKNFSWITETLLPKLRADISRLEGAQSCEEVSSRCYLSEKSTPIRITFQKGHSDPTKTLNLLCPVEGKEEGDAKTSQQRVVPKPATWGHNFSEVKNYLDCLGAETIIMISVSENLYFSSFPSDAHLVNSAKLSFSGASEHHCFT